MKKSLLASILAIIFTCVLGMGTVMADTVDEAETAALRSGSYYLNVDEDGDGEQDKVSLGNIKGATSVSVNVEEGTELDRLLLIFDAEVYDDSVQAVTGSSISCDVNEAIIESVRCGANGDERMTISLRFPEDIAEYEANLYTIVIPERYVIGLNESGIYYTNPEITVKFRIVGEGSITLDTPELTLDGTRVTWQSVYGADYYKVQYYEKCGETVVKDPNGCVTIPADQMNNTYLDYVRNFPLKPDCEYYVEVTAYPAPDTKNKASETATLELRGAISEQTSAPTGVNWLYSENSKNNTIITFDAEAGKYYFVRLYKNGEIKFYSRGIKGSWDLAERIEMQNLGNGSYQVELWVTDMNNLDLASNYALSPVVVIGNNSSQKADIKEALSSVTEDMSAEEVQDVAEKLTENGLEIVKSVLAKEATARENYEALEAAAAKASNVRVGKNLSTAEGIFSESIQADDIKVAGLALNAEAGSNVNMSISDVAESDKVQNLNKYFEYNGKTPVQLAIDVEGIDSFAYPIVITMPIPEGFNTYNLIVLHESKDADGMVTGIETIYPVVDKNANTMTFAVTHFSTFVVGNEAEVVDDDDDDDDDYYYESSSSTSSSSSSGKPAINVSVDPITEKPGVWVQDAIGWWYSFTDNTYPLSTWLAVDGKWYYFDAVGYMMTGWQLIAGKWYYLDAVNGDMAEGWRFIDGKWYYLNPVSGDMAEGWKLVADKYYYLMPGSGECLMNTITPDGFMVDESGAWIQ